MKYFWKVWKWENGGKSIEYTKYVTAPIFLEPHLDETLGTAEIILDCMPIAERQAFAPKTKIRIERYLTQDFSDSPTTYDYVVDSDQVEEYAGCPEYCCHRVHLIDPAVIAQGMHVDNIALTRELNDVDLNYKTILSSDEIVNTNKKEIFGSGYQRPNLRYGKTGRNGTGWHDFLKSASYKFTNSFRYVWSNMQSVSNLLKYLNGLNSKKVQFTVPTLTCQFLNGTTAENLFECPVRTKVIRTTFIDNKAVVDSEKVVVNHLYNPTYVQNRSDHVMYNEREKAEKGKVGLRKIKTEEYKDTSIGMGDTQAEAVFFPEERLDKFPAMINLNNTNNSSKEISFYTTPLSQVEIDDGKSYVYSIVCMIEPYESGAVIQSFTNTSTLDYKAGGIFIAGYANYTVTENSISKPQVTQIAVSTMFYCTDLLSKAETTPFLVKPKKYSCFDLIRKALLTVDTQVFDNTKIGLDPIYDDEYNDIGIQYPIIIDSVWMTRLKETQLHETIFENKNLWEILLQIGYYLHAIPYLRFAEDGTDKFILSFRQLGDSRQKNNSSTKITLFNSQNLSEYFTQLDSYVTNIFSPQNEVEEWLVPTTTDGSYLISNETAELQTKYNISEIVEFDISYNGSTLSALNYIFEKTVYNTLSSSTGLIPAKWAAIYYEMGTNKIQGLNYTPPTKNNDGLMALKKICGDLFGSPTGSLVAKEFKFNELQFHIKYKTQDTLRISQFKPNLYDFAKNSSFEKYPHHEQFFGQQDKIVDSERFSANLWGRLVRVANSIYQCQEYARLGEEKEVGELVLINNNLYYVVNIESEYYNDIILQKVTYSKNFNQISQVVTIPSEPRYYEISERSMIRREVRLMDFLLLTTDKNTTLENPKFFNHKCWKDLVKKLIFTDGGHPVLPNFAYTKFKADIKRQHLKENNEIIDSSVLYPNSETITVDGIVEPKASSEFKGVIVPLLHFPLRNAIVFEWDMDDNFKAGDSTDITVSGNNDDTDKAYFTLLPVRYCDVMGKADLFSFKLFNKTDWTHEQSQRLPFAEESDYIPNDKDSMFLLPDNLSIGLDKDNREALSFNYQINLLSSNKGDDINNFVTFSNIFGRKESRLKMLLLNHTVSMFDETVDLSESSIVADNVEYALIDSDINSIELKITKPIDTDLERVKAIVLYDTDRYGLRYTYLAKNVAEKANEEKLQSWWIYPVYNEI